MIKAALLVCFLIVALTAGGCGSASGGGECKDGEFRPCACDSESTGTQACLDQSWGICDCPPACEDGDTEDCQCGDGSSGSRSCLDGEWGDCECTQTDCTDGETRVCTCSSGASGEQTCAEGEWNVCECEQPECQNGEQRDCTCTNGLEGSQTCEEGSWGSCECVAECQEGDTLPCTCSDGESGEHTCIGGVWAECLCDPDMLVDLRGVFASLNVASTYSESIIGEVNSITVIISRLEFTQDGNQVTASGDICTIELDSGTSFITTIFPDSFIDALHTEPRQALLEEDEDGIHFVGERAVELRGVHLDDPMNDPLPTDADDPRIWDQDGDGFPGLTVIVEGIIDGDMYIIQRDISTWTGEVQGPDRVEGLLTFENQMYAVGATNDLLLQGNEYDTWQDPVAENSFLVFQRIDPSMTCDDILAERDVLFE